MKGFRGSRRKLISGTVLMTASSLVGLKTLALYIMITLLFQLYYRKIYLLLTGLLNVMRKGFYLDHLQKITVHLKTYSSHRFLLSYDLTFVNELYVIYHTVKMKVVVLMTVLFLLLQRFNTSHLSQSQLLYMHSALVHICGLLMHKMHTTVYQ